MSMAMGELLTFSQSSLLLLPKCQLQHSLRAWNPAAQNLASTLAVSSGHFLATKLVLSPIKCVPKKHVFGGIRATVISDSKMPTTFTVDSAGEGVDVLPDTGGGGNDFGNASGKGGGGGGGNNGGDSNDSNESEGDSGESKDENLGSSKKTALSMSQKLTLVYAFLVGAGGLMGYLKSGSQKSLISGGLAASLLYYVYTALPTKPVFASSLGFGLSAALLGMMGSRFKRSGKIFPAGIVSLVSLIMTGGYLHGIMRTAH
ncbi:uncharacterized protein [Coffea arabica]|uniref:Protein FATTY ACID EXPORT 2, chloroplastic-like n=1 Tax=Coffea arabica TaxID=13443 RepID=A0ABM4WQ09_COFAR